MNFQKYVDGLKIDKDFEPASFSMHKNIFDVIKTNEYRSDLEKERIIDKDIIELLP